MKIIMSIVSLLIISVVLAGLYYLGIYIIDEYIYMIDEYPGWQDTLLYFYDRGVGLSVGTGVLSFLIFLIIFRTVTNWTDAGRRLLWFLLVLLVPVLVLAIGIWLMLYVWTMVSNFFMMILGWLLFVIFWLMAFLTAYLLSVFFFPVSYKYTPLGARYLRLM